MVRNQTLKEYMRRLGQLDSGVKNKEFKIETENKSTDERKKNDHIMWGRPYRVHAFFGHFRLPLAPKMTSLLLKWVFLLCTHLRPPPLGTCVMYEPAL